jgi:hypothetical protein
LIPKHYMAVLARAFFAFFFNAGFIKTRMVV